MPDPLSSSQVIVGVTGGIAAFKAAGLVSKLVQAGAQVTVAMTPAATRFVTPLTFEALSGRGVLTSAWDHIDAHDPQHISLARAAHAAIVAPASMNCLAKLAAGMTDDVVTLILSAIDRGVCPVLLAPSMNAQMLAQPSTQRNLATLRGDGYLIVEPSEGWQACRTVGKGRLPEPEELLAGVREALARRRA